MSRNELIVSQYTFYTTPISWVAQNSNTLSINDIQLIARMQGSRKVV